MKTESPQFIGGPEDGKTLEERFPPGHMLHGKLPSGVRIPTDDGKKHTYEFKGGDYLYQGADDGNGTA